MARTLAIDLVFTAYIIVIRRRLPLLWSLPNLPEHAYGSAPHCPLPPLLAPAYMHPAAPGRGRLRPAPSVRACLWPRSPPQLLAVAAGALCSRARATTGRARLCPLPSEAGRVNCTEVPQFGHHMQIGTTIANFCVSVPTFV
ncbi:uncharacterized protein [Triticum aestivum]|uniref:uncharacterized protein n=1 Tax=Triticum aestivum TaxID=4565 RepID=UPI001D0156E3|nr:uncharacterized protein LOC123094773 [Triticum aestivum]